MSGALGLLCAQTLAAQTFVDMPPAAVAPSRATLRRDDDAVRAPRRRWRPSIEVGVATFGGLARVLDVGVVDWSAALTFVLGLDARRAVTDLIELHTRLELLGPQAMSVVPAALSARVAGMACAGSRSFDALGGYGAHAGASLGLRARVLSLRSPFYVGLALRLSVWTGWASGEAVASCVAVDGSVRTLDRQAASATATLIDLGGVLETGFRFGAREEAALSLRLLAGGIGQGEPKVRGAVLTFGWSLR